MKEKKITLSILCAFLDTSRFMVIAYVSFNFDGLIIEYI